MSDIFGRIFSGRIRELERELAIISNDYSALANSEYEKLSVVQMTYTPEEGIQATFEGNIAKILAAWAFKVLEVSSAKNYLEFQVMHPQSGAITITVQRTRGETPAAKAARLEAALAAADAQRTAP
jgi:hypothetical protein